MSQAEAVDLSRLDLPQPFPYRYTDEAQFSASLSMKGTPRPCDGLYPRDGSVPVTEIEEAIAQLTIPDQRHNVIVGAGMAGVSGATLFALQHQGRQHEEVPTLLHSRDLYGQSTALFTDWRYIGIRTRTFDAGSNTYLDGLGEGESPQVVFTETVANTPDMPVLDLHGLLARVRPLGEDGPIVVLDNTVPLSTGLDLKSMLRPEDRVLVVESATKSYMHNSEHLGVVYSPNEELIDGFRKYKARLGAVTSTGADPLILERLKAGIPSFHERNRALYESTGKIAMALAEAQAALGDNPEFTVTFPTLPGHPNRDYAEEHFDSGLSPVVFMATAIQEGAAHDLFKRIVEHDLIGGKGGQIDQGQIFMGQSFGFSEATILYDPRASYVRVAGGYDIDSDALAGALREAAADV